MKKLYRKSTVHPTPPSVVSEQLLSFLPAAILALTVALSPEDREVLAYLISCSGSYSKATSSNHHNQRKGNQKSGAAAGGSGSSSKGYDDVDHPPCFGCNCFRCYMSYWAKWNSSTNRQLIDEIIDAYEDSLVKESKKEKSGSKKERRKGKYVAKPKIELQLEVAVSSEPCNSAAENDSNAGESSFCSTGETVAGAAEEVAVEEELGDKGGPVRRIVNFVGERVLKLWG